MLCAIPNICYVIRLADINMTQENNTRKKLKGYRGIQRHTDYSLCYQEKDLQLKGYTFTDWTGDLDERKSISRYVFLIKNGATSWSSKKQSCIA